MYTLKEKLRKCNGFIVLAITMLSFIPFESKCKDTLPWDDKGELHVLIDLEHSDIWTYFIGEEFSREYDKRFGVFPTFMILKDDKRPVRTKWELDFWRNKTNWNYQSEWGDSLLWGDARKYLYWKLASSKTDEVIFLPVTQGDPNTNISKGVPRSGWIMKLEFDLNEWNIPDNETSYKITIEAHENTPIDGKGVKFKPSSLMYDPLLIDDLWIAKSTIKTPMDHYLLGEFDGTINSRGDKELLLMLQDHFIYATSISKSLLLMYFREKNADSLRWIAPYYLKSREPGMNPFINSMKSDFEKMNTSDDEGNRIMIFSADDEEYKPAIEWIHDMLFELDGDTTIYK
jgi:hypothetical protein